MRLPLTLWLLLAFSAVSQARQLTSLLSEADSLLGNNQDSLAAKRLTQARLLLSRASLEDSIWYNQLKGNYFLNVSRFDSSVWYFLASKNARPHQKESVRRLAHSINDAGIALYRMGKYDSAIVCHQESLPLYQSIKDWQGISFNYNNLGHLYSKKREHHLAISAQLQALEAATLANDTLGIGYINLGLGTSYSYVNNYINSIEYFLRAKKVFEQQQNQKLIKTIQQRLATIYVRLNEIKSAVSIYHSLVENYRSQEDKYQLAVVFFRLAEVYGKRQPDSVLIYLQKAELLFREIDNHYWLNALKVAKAGVYESRNQFELAQPLYLQVLEAEENTGNANHLHAVKGLAECYLYNGRPAMVLRLLNQTIEGFSDKIKPTTFLNYYDQLYRANKALGKMTSSLLALENYRLMKESVDNLQQAHEIAAKEFQFKLEKEQEVFSAEKERVQAELEHQQTLTYASAGGAFALVLIALLLLWLFVTKQKANNKLKRLNQQITHQKEEIFAQAEELSIQTEELKTTNEKLVDLSNFKEIMMGTIVHDLKNPLGILLNDYKNPERVKNESHRMLNLVTTLLDVQKFENAEVTLQPERIDFDELLAEVENQVHFLLREKSVSLHARYPKPFCFFADRGLLDRVLVNLLTNAIKFSPFNARIEISGSYLQRESRLVVTDFGEGISEEFLSKLFNSYQQLAPTPSGGIRSTGLGLTFCKLVVEAHGGKIWVDSQEGKGSSFVVSLPLPEEFELQNGNSSETIHLAPEPTFDLSDVDRQLINPFVEQMKHIEVYEITTIQRKLKEIPDYSPLVELWKKAVNEAILVSNAPLFRQLMELARVPPKKDLQKPG